MKLTLLHHLPRQQPLRSKHYAGYITVDEVLESFVPACVESDDHGVSLT